MANPFPFVSGDVLTAAELNGIGEVLTYTPTTGNLTLGNGTLSANYVRVQKLVYVQITLTFGSTSSLSGSPSFTLPVTAALSRTGAAGTTTALDAGVGWYVGGIEINATAAFPWIAVASGTYLTTPTRNISATVPMTWANGDNLVMNFVYEAA